MFQCINYLKCLFAIVLVGCVNHYRKQQSVCIGYDVALSTVLIVFATKFAIKIDNKKREGSRENISKVLNKYGLTLSDVWNCLCKYVGGHPEQDSATHYGLLFGVKNGKLIFFVTSCIYGTDGKLSEKDIGCDAKLIHLFDIPIDCIADIRYFDATTSSTVAIVGGNHWAIPIHLKKGDASVLIDWNDGRYNHSTEFRLTGIQANRRANTLRNTFIKITKD